MEQAKLKVFLCHTSQDKPIVRDIYRKLSAEGWIDPWLDEEKLLPGQDWEMEIEKAVESADVAIILISKTSVVKEGYLQKEIRNVLEIALEKPDGTIFIVPLRLDECEVPRKIRRWQYVDYFPVERLDWVYTKLLSSFKSRAKNIGIKYNETPGVGKQNDDNHNNDSVTQNESKKKDTNTVSRESQTVTFSDFSTMIIDGKPFSTGMDYAAYYDVSRNYEVYLYYSVLWDRVKRILKLAEYPAPLNTLETDYSIVWPEKVVVSPRSGWCAKKLPNKLKPLEFYLWVDSWKMLSDEEKGSWHKRFIIALNLVKLIGWLHERDIFLSKLEPNIFMINIDDGTVILVDPEKIVLPEDVSRIEWMSLPFNAPETVSESALPSVKTNQYSLAVLLYRIFFMRHPLIGPKIYAQDPNEDDLLIYGEKALYIENPFDRSNRPDRLPFTSDMLGEEVKLLFMRAFIDGLHNPLLRPTSNEWQKALQHLVDKVISCANPDCVMKAFVMINNVNLVCPWCGTKIQQPGFEVVL